MPSWRSCRTHALRTCSHPAMEELSTSPVGNETSKPDTPGRSRCRAGKVAMIAPPVLCALVATVLQIDLMSLQIDEQLDENATYARLKQDIYGPTVAKIEELAHNHNLRGYCMSELEKVGLKYLPRQKYSHHHLGPRTDLLKSATELCWGFPSSLSGCGDLTSESACRKIGSPCCSWYHGVLPPDKWLSPEQANVFDEKTWAMMGGRLLYIYQMAPVPSRNKYISNTYAEIGYMTRKMMLRGQGRDNNVTNFVTNWAATAALASSTVGTGISGYAASRTLLAGTDEMTIAHKVQRFVGSVAEYLEDSILGGKFEAPLSRTLSYGNFAVFMQMASWYIVWAAHWGPRFLERPVSRALYMKWSREVMNVTVDMFDEKFWTTLYGNVYLVDETKHRVKRANEVNTTKIQDLQGRFLKENRAGLLGEAFYQYYRSAFGKTTEERFGRTLYGNLLIAMNEQALLDFCIDMIFDFSAFGVDSKSRIHNHLIRSYLAEDLGAAFGALILPSGGTIKMTQNLRDSHGNVPYGDKGELYSDADDTVPLRHWWDAFYPGHESEDDHKAADYSNLWDRMRFLNVLFRVYSSNPVLECRLFSRMQSLNDFPIDADYCYRTSYSAEHNCCTRYGSYGTGP